MAERRALAERDDSASTYSSGTARSRSSRYSGTSHGSRMSRKSTETLVEVAALKAKLQYLGREAQQRAELERTQTEMELHIAQAKLEVLENARDAAEEKSRPASEVNTDHKVESFLRSQAATSEPVLGAAGPSLTGSDPLFEGSTPAEETKINRIRLNPDAHFALQQREQPIQSTSVDFVDLLNTAPHGQTPLPLGDHNVPSEYYSQRTERAGEDTSGEALRELVKSLAEQISLSRLPPPEPGVFYGDPMKYPSWKTAFQTLIEHRRIPPAERLHYLKKYIGGQVRETVESYFLLPPEDAFDEAKGLIEERYGSPLVIADAFRDRLEGWQRIGPRDGAALRRYADFLRQCNTAMRSIGSLRILNDERENRKMLRKLPDWIVHRWAGVVSQWREDKGEFPSFKEYMDFITRQARIATDPVTSLQLVRSDQPARERLTFNREKLQHNRESRTLATISDIPRKDSYHRNESCILCRGSHDLDVCATFGAKSLSDRKQFTRERGLCFACLRHGHVSRRCRQRKKCNVCSRLHPTSLHGDTKMQEGTNDERGSTLRPVESTSGTTLLNSTGSSRKTSMILPVYISHADKPNNERLVYAILDSQSDTTFILQDTCQSLGLAGTPVKLKLSTMHAENRVIDSTKVQGLMVRGFNNPQKIKLPSAYTRNIMPANRAHIPTPEVAELWPHLRPIAGSLLPLQDCEVGLLIGYNCTKALTPRDIIAPNGNGPYGQQTDLGWGIVGVVDTTWEGIDGDHVGVSHRIVVGDVTEDLALSNNPRPEPTLFSVRNKVKEITDPNSLIKMFGLDFSERHAESKSLSQEDRKFLSVLEERTRLREGRYEMPLPFRNAMPRLPNNKEMALQRLRPLKGRFQRDQAYHAKYIKCMEDLIDKGHAERVTGGDVVQTNHVWYLPHHGVYHPKKPGKLRVVFDGSARYRSWSLNDLLLQGPDFINSLCGVLCRFRKEPIAFVCDIEQMFLQFRVEACHRNYLRFLWWRNGDVNQEPSTYRMTRHLFGAVSSPGCANFALRKIATEGESDFGMDVASFIKRDFYVDDGLKSVSTTEEAVSLIKRSTALCKRNGLVLHKFLSNSKEVLKEIPPEARARGLTNIDIHDDSLPIDRTLGIQWCVESDTFQFRITLNDRPLTRRGVLSTLSSVYDPLGFVAPFILMGKQILQEMCINQSDWDSPIPENLQPRWRQWREEVKNLDTIVVKRCLRPVDFDEIVTTEIHHFSDASTIGYGQCSYLRLIDRNHRVHCSLIMAKARVTPIKPVTIPRLELMAALVSVRISSALLEDLDITNVIEWFWTDSRVVLGYIGNESRRFHIFVANRIQQIHDHTEPYQWNYIRSADNPADMASRGATPRELMNRKMWFDGPNFLWDSNVPFAPCQKEDHDQPGLKSDDPEVKSTTLYVVTESTKQTSIVERLKYFSDWTRARRAVALCLKYKDKLRERVCANRRSTMWDQLAVTDLQRAEVEVLKQIQSEVFCQELQDLNKSTGKITNSHDRTPRRLKRTSSLYRLDPFLDKNGLLRVGGRLNKGSFSEDQKHPVILPRRGHITELIISHFHRKIHHQGRSMTTNEIRQGGFWIIGCSSAVYTHVSKCVICRKHRGGTQEQKMSDLPPDRIQPEPPFTYSGVDFFGPFCVKEGRRELKRYGVLFTCMSSRAIHLEMATSLDTSSFINVLRRFVSIRGTIRQLRSDRGTNFVGASRELRKAVEEMNDDHLQRHLSNLGCDYIIFKPNTPSASHMGGVWERQIRTVRSILSSLTNEFGASLDDDSLRTFLCETMAIVNCRPLTVDGLNDPFANEPLTPNHLLTMKSTIILPPPGNFQRPDLYCRKRWRRVQYLANVFWTRWKREFVQTLQERRKWSDSRRNISIGDVVLIKEDNSPRNSWPLGLVVETIPSSDSLVRSVRLSVGNTNLNRKGQRNRPLQILERPIHKLVVLCEAETGEAPTEEPFCP